MSFITSPGVIVPPLTAGGVAYGTGGQAKMNSAGTTGQVLKSAGAGVPIWGAGGVAFATKTTTYTATAGDFLLCNTSAGAFTITLPASPVLNDQVYFQDSTGSFSTNALTINPGSNNIMGSSGNLIATLANAGFGLFYNGSEWRIW